MIVSVPREEMIAQKTTKTICEELLHRKHHALSPQNSFLSAVHYPAMINVWNATQRRTQIG